MYTPSRTTPHRRSASESSSVHHYAFPTPARTPALERGGRPDLSSSVVGGQPPLARPGAAPPSTPLTAVANRYRQGLSNDVTGAHVGSTAYGGAYGATVHPFPGSLPGAGQPPLATPRRPVGPAGPIVLDRENIPLRSPAVRGNIGYVPASPAYAPGLQTPGSVAAGAGGQFPYGYGQGNGEPSVGGSASSGGAGGMLAAVMPGGYAIGAGPRVEITHRVAVPLPPSPSPYGQPSVQSSVAAAGQLTGGQLTGQSQGYGHVHTPAAGGQPVPALSSGLSSGYTSAGPGQLSGLSSAFSWSGHQGSSGMVGGPAGMQHGQYQAPGHAGAAAMPQVTTMSSAPAQPGPQAAAAPPAGAVLPPGHVPVPALIARLGYSAAEQEDIRRYLLTGGPAAQAAVAQLLADRQRALGQAGPSSGSAGAGQSLPQAQPSAQRADQLTRPATAGPVTAAATAALASLDAPVPQRTVQAGDRGQAAMAAGTQSQDQYREISAAPVQPRPPTTIDYDFSTPGRPTSLLALSCQPYEAIGEGELTFPSGVEVWVDRWELKGWWHGRLRSGESGWFPPRDERGIVVQLLAVPPPQFAVGSAGSGIDEDGQRVRGATPPPLHGGHGRHSRGEDHGYGGHGDGSPHGHKRGMSTVLQGLAEAGHLEEVIARGPPKAGGHGPARHGHGQGRLHRQYGRDEQDSYQDEGEGDYDASADDGGDDHDHDEGVDATDGPAGGLGSGGLDEFGVQLSPPRPRARRAKGNGAANGGGPSHGQGQGQGRTLRGHRPVFSGVSEVALHSSDDQGEHAGAYDMYSPSRAEDVEDDGAESWAEGGDGSAVANGHSEGQHGQGSSGGLDEFGLGHGSSPGQGAHGQQYGGSSGSGLRRMPPTSASSVQGSVQGSGGGPGSLPGSLFSPGGSSAASAVSGTSPGPGQDGYGYGTGDDGTGDWAGVRDGGSGDGSYSSPGGSSATSVGDSPAVALSPGGSSLAMRFVSAEGDGQYRHGGVGDGRGMGQGHGAGEEAGSEAGFFSAEGGYGHGAGAGGPGHHVRQGTQQLASPHGAPSVSPSHVDSHLHAYRLSGIATAMAQVFDQPAVDQSAAGGDGDGSAAGDGPAGGSVLVDGRADGDDDGSDGFHSAHGGGQEEGQGQHGRAHSEGGFVPGAGLPAAAGGSGTIGLPHPPLPPPAAALVSPHSSAWRSPNLAGLATIAEGLGGQGAHEDGSDHGEDGEDGASAGSGDGPWRAVGGDALVHSGGTPTRPSSVGRGMASLGPGAGTGTGKAGAAGQPGLNVKPVAYQGTGPGPNPSPVHGSVLAPGQEVLPVPSSHEKQLSTGEAIVTTADGRRVKVVALTGHEILQLPSVRNKISGMAAVVHVMRRSLARRRAARAWAVGVLRMAVRTRLARSAVKHARGPLTALVACLGAMRVRRAEIAAVEAAAAAQRAAIERAEAAARAKAEAEAKARAAGPADPNAPKMKGIHWDGLLEENVKGTIWDTAANRGLRGWLSGASEGQASEGGEAGAKEGSKDSASEAPVPGHGLEEGLQHLAQALVSKFGVQEAKPGLGKDKGEGKGGAEGGQDSPATPAKPQHISVLDPGAARSVGISVGGFVGKRESKDVRAALLTLDAAGLGGLEKVQLLAEAKVLWDTEKMGPLMEYSGDTAVLVPAERFVKEALLSVPGLRQRLGVMEYQLMLPELVSGCQERLGLLLSASRELQTSRRFCTLLLDIILPLGNRMNAASKRAVAGFKIGSLNKLVQTKASSGETFLQFVVAGLLSTAPQVLGLGEDFPCLLKATPSALSRERVGMDMGRLEQGLKQTDGLLANPAVKADAELHGRLAAFSKDAAAAVAPVKSLSSEATGAFETVARWLGEDPSKTTPEALFGTIREFVSQVRKDAESIRERLDKARRAEERKAREEEEKKAREAAGLARAGSPGRPGPGGNNGGMPFASPLRARDAAVNAVAVAARLRMEKREKEAQSAGMRKVGSMRSPQGQTATGGQGRSSPDQVAGGALGRSTSRGSMGRPGSPHGHGAASAMGDKRRSLGKVQGAGGMMRSPTAEAAALLAAAEASLGLTGSLSPRANSPTRRGGIGRTASGSASGSSGGGLPGLGQLGHDGEDEGSPVLVRPGPRANPLAAHKGAGASTAGKSVAMPASTPGGPGHARTGSRVLRMGQNAGPAAAGLATPTPLSGSMRQRPGSPPLAPPFPVAGPGGTEDSSAPRASGEPPSVLAASAAVIGMALEEGLRKNPSGRPMSLAEVARSPETSAEGDRAARASMMRSPNGPNGAGAAAPGQLGSFRSPTQPLAGSPEALGLVRPDGMLQQQAPVSTGPSISHVAAPDISPDKSLSTGTGYLRRSLVSRGSEQDVLGSPTGAHREGGGFAPTPSHARTTSGSAAGHASVGRTSRTSQSGGAQAGGSRAEQPAPYTSGSTGSVPLPMSGRAPGAMTGMAGSFNMSHGSALLPLDADEVAALARQAGVDPALIRSLRAVPGRADGRAAPAPPPPKHAQRR